MDVAQALGMLRSSHRIGWKAHRRASPGVLAGHTVRRCHISLLIVVAGMFAAVHARAQVPAPAEPTTTTRWYGWQTLTADAASIGLVATDTKSPYNAAYVGLATFWAAPAVIHLAHGHPTRALASLGLRTLPFVLVLPAIRELEGGEGDNGSPGLATFLFALSIPAAIATDAVIARDVDSTRPARLTWLRYVPDVGVDAQGRVWTTLRTSF